jgi:hypothetical protein
MKIGHKDQMDKKILGRIASLVGVGSAFLGHIVQRCPLAPSMAALKGKGANTHPSPEIVTRKLFGLPGRICLKN